MFVTHPTGIYLHFSHFLFLYVAHLIRITGIDKNCYHHRFFIQGIEDVSAHLERITFKGNGARQPSSPESEPNFYDQSVCSSLRRIAVSSRVNLAASESLCGEKNINTFVQGQTSYGQRQQAPMCHTRNDAVVDSGRHLISGRSALIHPHFMNMLPTAFTLPNRGQVSNLVSNFIQHKNTEMVSYALNNHSLRAQNNIGILNADCFRSLLGSNAMVLNFEENLSDSSRDFQLQLSNQRLQEDISQLYSKNVRRLSEIKAHDQFMRSNDPK